MMLDMERRFQEGMDAPANQFPPMAKEEDQGDLVLELMQVQQVEGGAVAGKMKWRPAYWILVAAASVIVLAPKTTKPTKDQLFPPELVMFAVLLAAICLILQTMKKMM
ncbi:unnamed protein product [Urochloa humidicola]